MKARLWLDGASRGSWNMALDWAMLEQAALDQSIILRVYTWLNPTVSLGYFQSYSDFQAVAGINRLDCVRRVTGGGAILHDREWTYSIALPEAIPQKGHSERLYRFVHDSMVDWLNSNGYPVQRWLDVDPSRLGSKTNDSFMCFERRSDVDLVLGARKILGSAQRRTEHGILQHGSFLLEASPYFPSLEGLIGGPANHEPTQAAIRNTGYDLSVKPAVESDIDLDGFVKALKVGIGKLGERDWIIEHPPESCRQRASRIEADQFASENWTIFKRI